MKIKWLNKKTNPQLILFFNGWGMDEHPVEHLEFKKQDVVMFYDYHTLHPLQKELVNGYKQVFVIGWSMGVWAAGQILSKSEIICSWNLAINGTNWGIDDEKGIPKAMFEATRDHFTEASREKFFLRMCGSRQSYQFFQQHKPDRNLDSQQHELTFFINAVAQQGNTTFPWDAALIGSGDRIFPVANLKKAWEGTNNKLINAAHYPFQQYKSWDELINSARL